MFRYFGEGDRSVIPGEADDKAVETSSRNIRFSSVSPYVRKMAPNCWS